MLKQIMAMGVAGSMILQTVKTGNKTFHRPRAPKPNREPLESRTLDMASEIDMRFHCMGIDTGRDT
ncbi:MAG: hypothetical protein CR217_13700 [Beijerinckiaceae bacterium]|nr:MAG: hypothetical protein CR217_13700 [Beijerinckiaceae bacterium]